MYPEAPKYLSDVNAKVTKYAHSYIFIDLRQETPDELRIRSRILPKEYPMRIHKRK